MQYITHTSYRRALDLAEGRRELQGQKVEIRISQF